MAYIIVYEIFFLIIVVNIEENNDPKRRFQQHRKAAESGAQGDQPQNPHNQVGPNGIKRATDDYHYDKFKKQFRRY